MRRVSLRAILLPILASCVFGVLTYASVRVSENRNAVEAAFTDLRNIFGSLPGKTHTVNATGRSSKGVNFQKPAIDASASVGMVYATASEEWEAHATAQQPRSALGTTHPAEPPVGITEDDTYSIKGAGAAVRFHSTSNEPFATARPNRSPLGFHDTASPISSASTAGPGSATGSNVNPGKRVPCANAVPESSWLVLAGTAFAFSVFLGATKAISTWLSRRRRTHS